MKVYRAIEFSKLVFLLDEEGQTFWDYLRTKGEETSGGDSTNFNWWMDSGKAKQRRQIVSHICRGDDESFFEKSIQYNAMQGGRFNPSRSFGILYCATDPTIAALEVLYHLFYESYPIYKGMKKSSNQIGSSFNMKIPEKMKVIVPVFEIDLKKTDDFYHLSADTDSLRAECQRVGFRRYIGNNFSRDFLFGNDYEISRIIGCNLHTQDASAFFVPSARVDFELQDELELRNAIVPEKEFSKVKPKLSGRFREYRCEVDMEVDGKNGHRVKIESHGSKQASAEFWLQSTPTKKGNDLQTIKYAPDVGSPKEKQIYSRVVQVQKFHVPNDDESAEVE